MMLLAADSSGWHFNMLGYPLLLVIPLAAAVFWGIRRLSDRELAPQPPVAARGLAGLRGVAAAVLVLMLLEPTCSFHGSETELPTVAVLLDTSGSMSIKDEGMSAHYRLNEATALELVPSDLRDNAPMKVADAIDHVVADAPTLATALVSERAGPSDNDDEAERMREEARVLAASHVATLRELAPGVAGLATVSVGVADIRSLLEQVERRLEGERDSGTPVSVLIEDLRRFQRNGRDIVRRCKDAQRFSDAALVAGAERGSPIADGLEKLAELNRFERAKKLVTEQLEPLVEGRAKLKILGMARGLEPLDGDDDEGDASSELVGQTDFEAPLAALAGTSPDERLAGVLLLSDGRQTSGGDPAGAARSLSARGSRIAAVAVGNPDTPRDAVVGEILGSTEVFLGERIRLDVRYRISGFPEEEWDLVLSRPEGEIDRKTVKGSGRWQQERFELPADEAGTVQITARLERQGGPAVGGHGILREYWTGMSGGSVSDLTRSSRFGEAPDGREVIGSFSTPREFAENYGTRLRGYLIPPLTGSYTFWICSDDGAELWLSTDRSSRNKTRICGIDGWAAYGEWEKVTSQKSKGVFLRAGEKYYVEALHKEGSGQDHVAVGWQLPDSTLERPIPGERLLPYREDADGWAADADDTSVEASTDNNHAQIVVAVSEDPLRALLVDSLPRWESRYIVTMLERDKRVEIVRRYRSIALAQGERDMLPATQEDLDGFDVVVLGDMRPNELPAADQQRLANFVSRRGGFLVVIAGPRGMPSEYSLGDIADILPVRSVVDVSGTEVADERKPGGATLKLGRPASASSIVAVLDDEALNEKLWPALPPLTWIARGVAAKPGAEILLRSNDAAETPVVAVSRHGAGRVFYVGTDETWRWRDRLGDRVHQTFWLQALRWGLGERLRGKDARLQVSLDRSLMAPADAAELRARLREADGTPVDRSPVVTIHPLTDQGEIEESQGRVREMEMMRVSDSADTWRVPVEGLDEGRWSVSVVGDPDGAGELVEKRELVVRRAHGLEAIELGADMAALSRIAEAGGSRAGGLEDAEALLTALVEDAESHMTMRIKTFSLWDSYAALLVLLGVLAIEWVWRKRLGLP